MSIDTNRTRTSQSQRARHAAYAQIVLATFACFVSCTMQDFERLGNGNSKAVGGSTPAGGGPIGGATTSEATGGIGGTVDTSTTSSVTTSGGTAPATGGTTSAADTGSTEPACAADVSHGMASGATVKDCGACGVVCSLANANSATCSSGTCTPACSTGFADCNSSTQNDGCETDMTTTTNCGKCGHTCSTAGVATLSCTAGLCAPTCAPKYADCHTDNGSNKDDGCETYLDSLTQCGSGCLNSVACASNQVCNGGSCGAAQGLVVLSIPYTSAGQTQRYADKFPAYPDLSNTTLTMRMYAPGASNGTVTLYVVDKNFQYSPLNNFVLDALSEGWTDVTINIGAYDGTFDPRVAYQVTIEIASTGSSWENPTLIYVDSVRTANSAVNDTFSSSYGNWVTSTMLVVPNSTFSWADKLPQAQDGGAP